jgi:hypothetical protein
MTEVINVGDYVKVFSENRVFVVAGFTKGRKFIPDGWYEEEDGTAVNPEYCEKYKGATSCLKN